MSQSARRHDREGRGATRRSGDPRRVTLREGYSVSRIINGGWQLSAGHGLRAADEGQLIEDMLSFVKAGLTTFDCADIYTGVEELIGRFLREYRLRTGDTQLEGVQVHTKFVPDADVLPHISKGYTQRIIDRSLARLGVQRLDLVQLHWWEYDVPGYVETAGRLVDLQKAGKIRYVGATNFDVPRLAEIVNAGIDLVSHQVQFSLLDRRPLNGMLRFCRQHGLKLLCYGSLAGGFLTDRYLGAAEPEGDLENRSLTKYSLIVHEFGGWAALQRLLGAMRRIASRHGVDVAHVAMRSILEEEQVAAAIVGVRDARHLQDNLKVLDFRLGEEDRQLLRGVFNQAPGPAGDTFGLERVKGGPHEVIMKMNLNREAP